MNNAVGFFGLFLVGGAAILPGCTRPAAIWIEPGASTRKLSFRVARSREDLRPVESLDFITVRTCYGQPGPQVVLWEARGDVPKNESVATRITYGVAPRGFQNTAAPKALAGICLETVINGSGLSATVRFTVEDNGSITERKP